MKLYLAGPMRGYPKFNYEAFKAEAARLRSVGYDVVSPAEMDEADGMDFTSDETVEATVKRDSNGNPCEDYYLERYFEAIKGCGGIALMDGWEKSKGVGREIYCAISNGLLVFPEDYWLVNAGETATSLPEQGSEVWMVDPDTGAQKGQKLARFDLVPVKPLWEVAEHFGRGAAKYAEHNWAKGYRWSLCYQAAIRHLMQFWAGEDMDKQLKSKHVIAAAWHCLVLAFYMDVFPQKDDRPHKQLGDKGVPPVPH